MQKYNLKIIKILILKIFFYILEGGVEIRMKNKFEIKIIIIVKN